MPVSINRGNTTKTANKNNEPPKILFVLTFEQLKNTKSCYSFSGESDVTANSGFNL